MTTILFQGAKRQTDAASVAEFLKKEGIRTLAAIVEYKGEAYSPGMALDMPLEEGAELNVFHIVAGG